MSPPYRIDLSTLDRAAFKLTESGGLTLIQPLKTKHRWQVHELPLRSLVVDQEGLVRSLKAQRSLISAEQVPFDRIEQLAYETKDQDVKQLPLFELK